MDVRFDGEFLVQGKEGGRRIPRRRRRERRRLVSLLML